MNKNHNCCFTLRKFLVLNFLDNVVNHIQHLVYFYTKRIAFKNLFNYFRKYVYFTLRCTAICNRDIRKGGKFYFMLFTNLHSASQCFHVSFNIWFLHSLDCKGSVFITQFYHKYYYIIQQISFFKCPFLFECYIF